LQDNGGPTFTHQLLPGSPAINAGDPNFMPPPFFDQRGPGFNRVINGRIDKGSFEVQGPTPTETPSPTPTHTPTPTALDIDCDCNSQFHIYTGTDTNSYSYSDADCNSNGSAHRYSYNNSKADTDTEDCTNTAVSPYSGTAPLVRQSELGQYSSNQLMSQQPHFEIN
jgi:hypothetical protein